LTVFATSKDVALPFELIPIFDAGWNFFLTHSCHIN